MYDINNTFYKILQGLVACNKVYEDDFSFAFYDIEPKAPTHILTIPKGKYTDATDFHKNASDKEIINFYKAIEKICAELKLDDNGYRLVTNIGKDSGQIVQHYHVHILAGKKLGDFS